MQCAVCDRELRNATDSTNKRPIAYRTSKRMLKAISAQVNAGSEPTFEAGGTGTDTWCAECAMKGMRHWAPALRKDGGAKCNPRCVFLRLFRLLTVLTEEDVEALLDKRDPTNAYGGNKKTDPELAESTWRLIVFNEAAHDDAEETAEPEPVEEGEVEWDELLRKGGGKYENRFPGESEEDPVAARKREELVGLFRRVVGALPIRCFFAAFLRTSFREFLRAAGLGAGTGRYLWRSDDEARFVLLWALDNKDHLGRSGIDNIRGPGNVGLGRHFSGPHNLFLRNLYGIPSWSMLKSLNGPDERPALAAQRARQPRELRREGVHVAARRVDVRRALRGGFGFF